MVGHTVELGALLHVVEILLYLFLLLGGSYLLNILALWSQDHEGNTKHGIGTGGEDGELHVAVLHREHDLCTFGTTNPVLLSLLDGVAPLDSLQSVEQTLGVSGSTQAPLLHLLLDDRIATTLAHAVHNLVVGKYRTQAWAPVHHRLAEVSDAVVHQYLLLLHVVVAVPLLCGEVKLLVLSHVEVGRTLLLEVLDELLDRLRLLASVAEEGVEHLLESPLSPMVILGVAGANLAVPVEREADLVELLTVAVDVGNGSYLRMLTCLDGILLGGQSVGVVTHGVEHVEATLALVAGIYVAGDVAQGVTHVQAGSRRVGEHVEHIVLLAAGVLRHLVGLLLHPRLLPLFLNFSEIVVHCVILLFCFSCLKRCVSKNKYVCKVTPKSRERKANAFFSFHTGILLGLVTKMLATGICPGKGGLQEVWWQRQAIFVACLKTCLKMLLTHLFAAVTIFFYFCSMVY